MEDKDSKCCFNCEYFRECFIQEKGKYVSTGKGICTNKCAQEFPGDLQIDYVTVKDCNKWKHKDAEPIAEKLKNSLRYAQSSLWDASEDLAAFMKLLNGIS